MKKCFMKVFIVVLILLSSLFFLTNNSSAYFTAQEPYANFDSDQFTLISNVLDFTNNLRIDSIVYFGSTPPSDPLLYGYIVFTESIYQSGVGGTHFADSLGGGINFDVRSDPNTDFGDTGITYFSGTLDPFDLSSSGSFAWFNTTYNLENVGNLSFGSQTDSQFMTEYRQNTLDAGIKGRGNFGFMLTFTSGDLASGGSGSVAGKLAAAPEPVSSLLFIIGGATLGFRRYLRRKNISSR